MTKQRLSSLKKHWLWLAVNGIGVTLTLRAAWMVADAPLLTGWVLFTNSAALRDIVLFSGKTGLILLVLSLACTPVARLLGWNAVLQVRKSLGLWGFGFACFHSLFFLQGKPLFTDLSGARLWQVVQDMMGFVLYDSKVPYAEAGVYALMLLIPLALTSNRLAMRRLGKYWKRLHCLVYLAVPVAVYHYWWRSISTFPVPPSPDYWQPILFAVVVGLLLVVRIPLVRRWLVKRLKRTQSGQGQRDLHRTQGVPSIDYAAMTPRLDRHGGRADSTSMNEGSIMKKTSEGEISMRSQRIIAIVISFVLYALTAMPALAGGWTVVTVDELPPNLRVGEATMLGFTVRQHGIDPINLDNVVLTAQQPLSGEQLTFPARQEGAKGHYVVEVLFPSAGEWNWEIQPDWFPPVQLEPMTVMGEAEMGMQLGNGLLPWTLTGLGVLLLSGAALLPRPPSRRLRIAAVVLALALILGGLGWMVRLPNVLAAQSVDQVAYGRALFTAKGCATCHLHSAVANTWSTEAGPNLSSYTNTPDYLRTWLKDPQAIKPNAQMPNLALKAQEVEALTAFLTAEE